jgi:alkylated DNA repair dioxygenase AlkB
MIWPIPFLSRAETLALRVHLERAPWEQQFLVIAGKTIPVPRLTCWYGPSVYRYTGGHHAASPVPDYLRPTVTLIEEAAQQPFNSILLNFYRDGADSVGWHSDDDYRHGGRSAVASLSIGATRTFDLRPKGGGALRRLRLTDGDLLVMPAGFQDRWEHRVPKEGATGARFNLTLRWVEL